MSSNTTDKYWATLGEDEIVPELVKKVDAYYDFLRSSGLWSLWMRSHEMYQWGASQSTIEQVGQDSEFESIVINHYRNILRHIYVGTTSTRPGFQPRAINTDYKSKIATRICDGMLEFYLDDKRGEQHAYRAAEAAIVTGEGYIFSMWDPQAGKVVGSEQVQSEDGGEPEERPLFEGDLRVENPHPCDVIRDVTRRTWDGMPWHVVRRRVNRFDLAARYPEKADEILSLETGDSSNWDARSVSLLYNTNDWDADELYVYHFFHERTPAVPFGRVVVFTGDDVLLEATDLEEMQLQKPTLIRIAGDEIEGSPFGYTFAYDLMAIQDAINLAHSTALTNISNFGVTNLTGPANATVKFEQLAKGLNWLGLQDVREGQISTIDLLQIPAELLTIVQEWVGAMETLSGVNSVSRGNPEASLKSGAALALVQSQFIEFTKDFQGAYFFCWGEFTTMLVRLFRTNVTEARAAAIVGKGDRSYVKEILGSDLENVDRVRVEPASALARTAAGRLQIAEDMLAAGFVQTPEQYMAVRETGRLEPLTHHATAQLDLISAENEALMEGNIPQPVLDELGQQVPDELGQPMMRPGAVVVFGDDDVLHIKEHSSITCDPDVRRNETIMAATLEHIQQHINQLLTRDPVLAAVLGLPGGPAQPGAAPGAPGDPAAGGDPSNAQTLPAVNPATGEQAQITPPNDPSTGQDWQAGGAPA